MLSRPLRAQQFDPDDAVLRFGTDRHAEALRCGTVQFPPVHPALRTVAAPP